MLYPRQTYRLLGGLLTLLLFAPAGRADFIVNDPQGDNLGIPDIGTFSAKTVTIGPNQNFLNFTVTFLNSISDPTSQGDNPIFGFIDIDADQSANNGMSSADLLASRGFGSLPGLGVDYYIDLNSVTFNNNNAEVVNLIDANGNQTSAAIQYTSNSLTVSVALSDLGGSSNVNAGMIAIDATSSNTAFVSDTAAFIQGPAVVPAPGGLTLLGTGVLFLGGYYLCSRRRMRASGLSQG